MSRKFRIRSAKNDVSLLRLLAEACYCLLFTLVLVSPIYGLLYILGALNLIGITVAIIITFLIFLLSVEGGGLACIIRGHYPDAKLLPSTISGFDGDEIIFEGRCARCGATINVSARYDSVKFPTDIISIRRDVDLIPDQAERKARIMIADALREGADPSQAALRIYALYHMIVQARRLHRLELPEYESLPPPSSNFTLDEVLREVGVKLDFEVSEKSIYQLRLRGDRLYVEAPYLLSFAWRERGVGSDIIELRVLEAIKQRHANKIIALIQLLGKPLPRSPALILDTVMIGRDDTGPWLLRAPPNLWLEPLETQLSWATGFRTPRRRGFIEA